MKVVLSGRRSGKTTKMIEWLASNPNNMLLVATHKERRRILKTFGGRGDGFRVPFLEKRIITCDETNKLIGRADLAIGIDNADIILEFLLKLNHPINIISLTIEENGI